MCHALGAEVCCGPPSVNVCVSCAGLCDFIHIFKPQWDDRAGVDRSTLGRHSPQTAADAPTSVVLTCLHVKLLLGHPRPSCVSFTFEPVWCVLLPQMLQRRL